MTIDFISDINKELTADLNYPVVDRFIVKVLWWHLGVFVILAVLNAVVKISSYYPSPLAWRVISIPEAVIAIMIACVATVGPALLVGRIRTHYVWRIVAATALTLYSYLFVFISGGSIEMHFHFFIVIALLVTYADWRLGWIVLLLTGFHHGILNYIEPGWVYYYGRNDFAVVAHAIPVLVEVIFTTVLCLMYRSSFVALKDSKKGLLERTNELEKLKGGLEVTVTERTGELSSKVSELESVNKLMIDRELKMVELKKENAALSAQLHAHE